MKIEKEREDAVQLRSPKEPDPSDDPSTDAPGLNPEEDSDAPDF